MIFTERGYVMYENTKHINAVINGFRIYLVFLQHFENKWFQTTNATSQHGVRCDVTTVLWYQLAG
jgi:hypothetical protein